MRKLVFIFFQFIFCLHYNLYSQKKNTSYLSLNSYQESSILEHKFSKNEIYKPKFHLLPLDYKMFATPKASVFCRMEDAVRKKTSLWLMIRVDSYNYKNHNYH
jgi:hypothetical protein